MDGSLFTSSSQRWRSSRAATTWSGLFFTRVRFGRSGLGDPVLASDVQVAEPSDRDRLRFSLTGESGLNDGTRSRS